jgi:pSer/pThr/pTyr-binding forkhead associated (FHA) protein
MSTLLLTSLGIVCPACEVLNSPAVTACRVCSSPLAAGAHPAAKGVPPGMKPTAKPAAVPPKVAPTAATPLTAKAAAPAKPSSPPKPAEPVPLIRPTKPAQWILQVVGGSAQGQVFKMPSSGAAVVGRVRGAFVFEDFHVSPLHATFLLRDGNVVVRDENSASGVFIRIKDETPLGPKMTFSAGNRLFRYVGSVEKPKTAPPGRPWPYGAPTPADMLYIVEELLMGGRPGKAAISAGPSLTIGQVGCDLNFSADEELSLTHCEVAVGPAGAKLKDVSSGIGVFVRIQPATEQLLQAGDEIRIGSQILRLGS